MVFNCKFIERSFLIYGRIPVDYAPMQDLSIDIKMMPQAFGGYHLLLVIKQSSTLNPKSQTCYELFGDKTHNNNIGVMG